MLFLRATVAPNFSQRWTPSPGFPPSTLGWFEFSNERVIDMRWRFNLLFSRAIS
jgi:hypothetical protein